MAVARVFALDITENSVGGILFTEGKQGPEILAVHFCFLNESVLLENALAEVIDKCEAHFVRCLLSIGAEQFNYRLLNVPFIDRKKVRSVTPFEIEDSASFQDEPFLYDYLLQPPGDDGTNIFAVLVERQAIERLLDLLKENDLDPELITVSGLPKVLNLNRRQNGKSISFALLQIDLKRTTIFIVIDNEVKAIRSISYNPEADIALGFSLNSKKLAASIPQHLKDALEDLAADIEYTLVAVKSDIPGDITIVPLIEGVVGSHPRAAEIILQELKGSEWEGEQSGSIKVENYDYITENFAPGCLENALALACCNPKDRERINFRKDEYAFTGRQGRYSRVLKAVGAALVLVICGMTVYLGVDFQSKQQQRAVLTQEIKTLYRETVAGSTPGPDPVKQLQVKVKDLNEASATGTVHDPSINTIKLLADISARLPKSLEVSFDRLIYDRKTIRIKGLTDNFNSVDLMKNSLAESPLFADVAIGSANIAPKEKGVRFELKLQL